MSAAMAANRQIRTPVNDLHHPHHQQQGPPPPQHLHQSRPSSIVQQQQHHNPQAHAQQPQQQQPQHHQGAYSSAHSIPQSYQAGNQGSGQDNLNYYSHPSPYSTPGATSGYTSADTSDMMAAAQMPRPPYPPMSYHTPQSNSPASVASPSQHDQHRSIYGQPPSQHMPQSMYYQPQPHQYQSMPHQQAPSPYAPHPQHPQHSMTSQQNMMMSHAAPQNQMSQHAAQHAAQQHAAQHAAMTNSPRPKIEPQVPLQMKQQQQPQTSPMPQAHHQQNAQQLQSPGNAAAGVNPNAAPGPIPATTPLVVRQDGNGVQWIAFEYSRDRVKMEYTIRCDVESVNTDELSPEFKQENCVYPRACCPKEQYRGNRLMYETDCNRVGWALAQLNVPLRGKRGLIQRAVDSWRNSNQDPRLRSRRVRRMAKMNNRKQVQASPHPASAPHMPGPAGMAQAPAPMGPGSGPPMGKPGMGNMGQPMHHHAGGHPDAGGHGGGDEVGSESYQHHGQVASVQTHGSVLPADTRQTHIFQNYANQEYQMSPANAPMPQMAPRAGNAAPARRHARAGADAGEQEGLFPDLPEARKRKFILVEDSSRGSRLRVRVTLEGVDTGEIPDSFRKGASVFPRSYFPREMQSPPPSAMGSQFFSEDAADDGIQDTEGRESSHRVNHRMANERVKVGVGGDETEDVVVPRMRRSTRTKEVRLNDLAHRMAWLQSRVFTGRTVFLQRALDCYRTKTRAAAESDSTTAAVPPQYQMRVGKKRWNDRRKRIAARDEED